MKTESQQIVAIMRRIERLAIERNGQSIRRILVNLGGFIDSISPQQFEGNYLPSEYVGEIFAIGENGRMIYFSFERANP